jgi:hypothetical protein
MEATDDEPVDQTKRLRVDQPADSVVDGGVRHDLAVDEPPAVGCPAQDVFAHSTEASESRTQKAVDML